MLCLRLSGCNLINNKKIPTLPTYLPTYRMYVHTYIEPTYLVRTYVRTYTYLPCTYKYLHTYLVRMYIPTRTYLPCMYIYLPTSNIMVKTQGSKKMGYDLKNKPKNPLRGRLNVHCVGSYYSN